MLLYYYIDIIHLDVFPCTKIPTFNEKKKKNLIFLQVFNNI